MARCGDDSVEHALAQLKKFQKMLASKFPKGTKLEVAVEFVITRALDRPAKVDLSKTTVTYTSAQSLWDRVLPTKVKEFATKTPILWILPKHSVSNT